MVRSLRTPLTELTTTEDRSLIHGDAHEANLLHATNGKALLCDFDSTATGPRQLDLVAAAVKEIRFPPTGGHAKPATTYRYDVTTDPAWPLLRQARDTTRHAFPVVAVVELSANVVPTWAITHRLHPNRHR